MTHRDDSMTRRVTGVHQAFVAGGRQAAPGFVRLSFDSDWRAHTLAQCRLHGNRRG